MKARVRHGREAAALKPYRGYCPCNQRWQAKPFLEAAFSLVLDSSATTAVGNLIRLYSPEDVCSEGEDV